ncbi:arginine--tRNA ligase [Calidifontibacter sp. DB0510]|uniref:Arginine--tRNA ligase n=1 Tax=Metallococcus carri TaxID=1656884 RepID=A0A967EG58_9MICO|nr:arginine--tRNA ligase [Metallococcus carri]NHN57256.1 arginine--tRNA ligase [Metallococcus carri]NOP37941.1 arginine--tRNA ligase [Calidifontibacter sp. DB2511S]
MVDPALALTVSVQQAMGAAFGREYAGADPVVRPANKKQTTADLQVNAAMALAKQVGRPPREVAQAILDHLDDDGLIAAAEIAGPGFINVTLSTDWIARHTSDMLASDRLGVEAVEHPERIPVDYSSPNVAKEMHVGHLRTTVVGDSLVRTLEFLGHEVFRQNHVGDWGTPFGMLIEHLLEAGEDSDEARLLEDDPNEFYQHANAKFKAAEGDSANDFDDRARRRVTLLQGGDADTMRHWDALMERSKAYFNKVYAELDVTLTDDDLSGESQYNDELAEICDDLEARGIARIDNGALCVFLDGFVGRDDQPLPLIIRKSDGGYGYATTDIATVRHYSRDLLADRAVYVVGATQNLHFRMAWAAADKAGYIRPETTPIHVQIGNVLGKDSKLLRTRSGDSMKLQYFVDQALERAATVVAESRPDLPEDVRATIAQQVGIGALKYADLSVAHDSEYIFDLDRMLALTGNTGPYLQYATARIRSILGRADAVDPSGPIVLTEPAERALALRLLDFGAVVHQVGETLQPHRLAAYLFDLAQHFTAFYEQCPVLKAEDAVVRSSRLALCALTEKVLVRGLSLLGIQAPDQM